MILKVNETAHRDFTSGIILLNPAIFQAESYKGRIKSNFMNQRFRYRKYLTYALASGILSASLTLGGCADQTAGGMAATPAQAQARAAAPEEETEAIAPLNLSGQILPDLDDVELPENAEPVPEYLREGVRHEIVKKLQQRLMDLGFMDNDEPTDYFGQVTLQAVKHFQRQNEMPQDGIVGDATWEALMAEDAKYYAVSKGTQGDETEEVDAYYFPINEELDEAISLAHSVNKEIIPFTSFLNNQDILIKFKNSVSYNKINSILVGDYGALQIFKDKKCILDSTFNLYNSYALNYFNNHDAILSLEMSRKQVNHLNNIKQNIIMTVYGKTINMHLKHCLISDHYFNCKKIKCNLCKQGKFTLIDRKGEQFDIFPDQDCNNLIFNSHCLYIDHLEKLEVDFILLSFSNEAPEITKAVFRDFKNNIMFAKPRQISLKTKLTNGYFYD